jgi:hypothetical protein
MSDQHREIQESTLSRPRRNVSVMILIAGVVAVVVLIWNSVSKSEPSHDGKLLSEWAMRYGTNRWGVG